MTDGCGGVFVECFTRRVLDHGYVTLTNVAGPVRRLDGTFDADMIDVARAARVSYGREANQRPRDKDIRLVNRLIADKHTTPLEAITVYLDIKVPIFVQRQWTRHRTWKYMHVNETSRRYTAEEPEFYIPAVWRRQSRGSKQGSAGRVDQDAQSLLNARHRELLSGFADFYRLCLSLDVAREQARIDMPVCTYTRMSISVDLLNLQHFLDLRSAPDAQYEVREYAAAIRSLLCQFLPGYTEVFGESS